jgi:tetratricopeptide (TPR) repeat protein
LAVSPLKLRVAVLSLVLVIQSATGQSASANFDDLSRRAEAAIDGHPSEAVSLYQQALALRPSWAEGWFYLGTTLLRLGRLAESRDALRKGALLEPGKGTSWAYLGLAEYELGEYQQALSDILKGESIGLANRPEFIAEVHYRAGLLYLRFSDPAQALEQLRPLVRSGNDSPAIIQALGVSALFLKVQPANVTPDKQTLVDLAGHAAWAFLAERTDLCAPLFEKLAAQFPNEPSVHYLYGMFLLGRDSAAAEKEFRKELRITPSHVLARVQLALLLSHRGEAAPAEKFAREAVQLEPLNPLCQVTLGRALLSADRTTRRS